MVDSMKFEEKLSKQQGFQEAEYAFPYHYLPDYCRGKIVTTRFWPWTIPYLGRIKLVMDFLNNHTFLSLVDIGCGDGKLINVVQKHFGHAILCGVDYSDKSIQIARCLNYTSDKVRFDVHDLTERSEVTGAFDVATMVEVLEHIPVDELDIFLQNSLAFIRPRGHLLLTVPSDNIPVSKKHYQHFSVKQLAEILENHQIDIMSAEFIDSGGLIMGIFHRLLRNSVFILNSQRLVNAIFRYYVKCHLHANETRGRGIFLVAQKR